MKGNARAALIPIAELHFPVSFSPQGLMTVSLLATQGDLDSVLDSSLDTQPAVVTSPPSASPPPTLVPITNIPPPQPFKPQVRLLLLSPVIDFCYCLNLLNCLFLPNVNAVLGGHSLFTALIRRNAAQWVETE